MVLRLRYEQQRFVDDVVAVYRRYIEDGSEPGASLIVFPGGGDDAGDTIVRALSGDSADDRRRSAYLTGGLYAVLYGGPSLVAIVSCAFVAVRAAKGGDFWEEPGYSVSRDPARRDALVVAWLDRDGYQKGVTAYFYSLDGPVVWSGEHQDLAAEEDGATLDLSVLEAFWAGVREAERIRPGVLEALRRGIEHDGE